MLGVSTIWGMSETAKGPQDYKEAAKWYLKAAEQDNAFGQ